jgi:hypothetical protein
MILESLYWNNFLSGEVAAPSMIASLQKVRIIENLIPGKDWDSRFS